ncbi:MAG: hypothetical protein ACRDFA_13430 [bacterium]
MHTLECFVITPSGKNAPMRLAVDAKRGLCAVPSSCVGHPGEIAVNFQHVYKYIILEAIREVNRSADIQIQCTRGEDLPQGGNIVSQFLQHICRAEITITDLTGLNPNVLLEYGIRLSVRDSLNLVLCHEGLILPRDIGDQRCIEYSLGADGATKTREEIVRSIQHSLPTLLQERPDTVDNLFRRTVELATGRTLERRLAQAFEPAPGLVGELLSELQRLDHKAKLRGDPNLRADPTLRYRAWKFLDDLGKTLRADPAGPDRAIETYRLMAALEGFSDKRLDVFLQLHEICAADPNRKAEAQGYLEKVIELDG